MSVPRGLRLSIEMSSRVRSTRFMAGSALLFALAALFGVLAPQTLASRATKPAPSVLAPRLGESGVRVDLAPAVPIDTMAEKNGQDGIQVGGDFYAAKPRAWAQVLVLDRKTLEPANSVNESIPYPCGSTDFRECAKKLLARLADYNSSSLVVVSAPADTEGIPQGSPPYDLVKEGALERIGVSKDDFPYPNAQGTGLARGTFSAIGVPTEGPAMAVAHAADSNTVGGGRITGYLILDNAGNYTYTSSDQGVPYDTQAPGSDAERNVIRVGHITSTSFLDAGFHIMVVDRKTLRSNSYAFDTSAPFAGGKNLGVLRAMLQRLTDANAEDNIVLIASRGDPTVKVPVTKNSPIGDLRQAAEIDTTIQRIADKIEALGGTRNGIFAALDPALSNRTSYTLVGGSRLGPGFGEESTAGGTSMQRLGMNTAPLAGTLGRTGHNYEFEVQGEEKSPGGRGGNVLAGVTDLSRVAFQAPSQWPEAGYAARTAAIQYVGERVLGTKDPRSQYWTLVYSAGTWSGVSAQIGALQPTASAPLPSGVTQADLDWAKAELRQEIGWLESVHAYLGALATPFSKDQLQSWAELQTISHTVNDKVRVSPDKLVHLKGSAAFSLVRNYLGLIPEAGKAFEAANQIYEFATRMSEIDGEPGDGDFQAKADELGVELAKRLTAGEAMLSDELPNVIAADYQKLKTVGSCASVASSEWVNCPAGYDPSDWRFTQRDQLAASAALIPQLKVSFYSALVPAKYKLYRLPLWWRTRVNGYKALHGQHSDFYGETLGGPFAPFDTEPETGQYAKPILRTIPVYTHQLKDDGSCCWTVDGDAWEIFALGFLTGGGTIGDPWVMNVPDSQATDPLFLAPDKSHPNYLGVFPETFFDRAFSGAAEPVKLDHYPEADTLTGWCIGFPSLLRPGYDWCNGIAKRG